MGSFLEKYDATEWDVVAEEVIGTIKKFERILKADEIEVSQKDRVKYLSKIKKLKKDFIE
jgi:hypothetical protein